MTTKQKKPNRRVWSILLPVIYIAVLVVTVALILKLGSPQKTETPKIGFITTGSMDEPGWNAFNYEGIRAACKSLNVELLVRDGVRENDGSCPKAVAELVEEGAEMIILSADGYSQEMEPLFSQYPQIFFYGLHSNFSVSNLTGYSTRMYQARYLSGIIAGFTTQTGKVGFVATTPTSEVYRGVNAFALGVQRVRPDAEVVLYLTGSAADPEADIAAAQALIQKENVDVITHHQNQYSVIEEAERSQIASIGYYGAERGVSDKMLARVSCNWEMLYTALLEEYLRGRSTHIINDWLGLESNVIDLTGYSSLVSPETIDEVQEARQEILSGLDVFTNEIYDNEGNLRCDQGEAISDNTLIQGMDWLVEGVRVYE